MKTSVHHRTFCNHSSAMVLLAACALLACTSVAAQAPGKGGNITRYEFSVRTVSAAELPKDSSGEWMQFFGFGLASGALGLAAPPMFASGLVVGGLLLAPGALIISSMDRRDWEQTANALKSTDFERQLLRATEARAKRSLPAPAASSDTAPVLVELVVNAYGLAGSRQKGVCFIASIDLVATHSGNELLRDRMIIAPFERSTDAPPPQCATMERMAEREGQLVRDTAAIYAEVLAVMAIDRLIARSKP